MNKDKNRYCVIMAGGVGSRFWPVSRPHKPKQFLDILGTGKTFIRQTFERFLPIIPVENFIVVTNKNYKELVEEQLPELIDRQILTEPIGRNTAPCIAYAACHIRSINPEATMIVSPADHLITNENEFRKVIEQSASFVEREGALMTIGIEPSRPDTGFGYIQIGKPTEDNNINRVKTFTEKPNLEMAEIFLHSGDFLWNSGIFVWKNSAILEAMGKFLPEVQQLFDSIESTYNTSHEREAINRIYPECRNISIDFGVMEKADNVYVRSSNFGWSDVGTWKSFYLHSEQDAEGNVRSKNTYPYNTKNTIVKAPDDKIVVVDSLDGYLVVVDDDAIMITPRDNESSIKRFTDDIKYKTEGNFS